MVTEKNSDVQHDFFNDPLRLQSDGIWLKVWHLVGLHIPFPLELPMCTEQRRAIYPVSIVSLQAQGTTLGADNGIGVATALALLDMPENAKLPPLECLFTVDEETGLTGAFDLDANMLTGAEHETGLFCIGEVACRYCTLVHLVFTWPCAKVRTHQ